MTTPNDQSETPRTDAEIADHKHYFADTNVRDGFARTLERELTDLRTQLAAAQRERDLLQQKLDAHAEE